jgi:hypothetical protein
MRSAEIVKTLRASGIRGRSTYARRRDIELGRPYSHRLAGAGDESLTVEHRREDPPAQPVDDDQDAPKTSARPNRLLRP